MVMIKKDYILVLNDNCSGYVMIFVYIMVYNIVNIVKGVNVKMYVNYVKNFSIFVSWYFIVDDLVIYQYFLIDENGWYVGDGINGIGNCKLIGIEICENVDGDFEKVIVNVQWLI